jgi:hypothetical protein
MFVELSKDVWINLGVVHLISFERNKKIFQGLSACLLYPDGSKSVKVGSEAWAIYRAIVVQTCRLCGCTDADCSECIAATGEPCHWVEDNLCSRCAEDLNPPKRSMS